MKKLFSYLVASMMILGVGCDKFDNSSSEDNDNSHKIPNNQIWYTSSDAVFVTPCETDAFGASIISNIYENGRGIITFDGNITSIGSDAFYDCDRLTSITIPNSVKLIGWDAFSGCSKLTSVTIGSSVTSIGHDAFFNCRRLTSITIPDSVNSIGDGAFGGCENLTSVTIGKSVNSIGSQAFRGCSSLTSFNGKFASADNRCLIIDGVLHSFAPAGLTTYTIPDSVNSIGEYAFADCNGLTSVTFPDSITAIGNDAFVFCESLSSIIIPDRVTSIGSGAFYDCVSLTSITIGKSVTSIGALAFSDCISLTSITIPDSVTLIENAAFDDCSSLTTIYCKPATPPTLGGYIFSNALCPTIYVPTASVDAYRNATTWSEYAGAIFADPTEN